MYKILIPLLLFLIPGYLLPGIGGSPIARFNHITLEDGLSQSTVYAIFQDSKGFTWIGTEDGLNRYDGYSFKVFRPSLENPDSINGNIITAIAETPDSNLWIGTNLHGLNKYDPRTAKFTNFLFQPDKPGSLSSNIEVRPYVGGRGTLWVGTAHGLNRYLPETGSFRQYFHDPQKQDAISHNNILSLHEDSNGALWVGTPNGLNRMAPGSESFTHYPALCPLGKLLPIVTIHEDASGQLWLGTTKGLYHFHKDKETFPPVNPSAGYVTSITQTSDGMLWFASPENGLTTLEPGKNKWNSLSASPGTPGTLETKMIRTLHVGKTGLLWVGTVDRGLYCMIPEGNKFKHYTYNTAAAQARGISHNLVYSFAETLDGHIWIGTRGGGLTRLDRSGPTEEFTHYRADPGNPKALRSDVVHSLYCDRDGVLWIGTPSGIHLYNPETGGFTRFFDKSKPGKIFRNSSIRHIFQDSKGFLWFGTSNGLLKYDPNNETSTSYRYDSNDPAGISNNLIKSISADKKGLLWIGTARGLNLLNPATGKCTRYFRPSKNRANGLTSDHIQVLYHDRNGTLWIGTYGGGLNRFDGVTNTFSHFREKDGLANDTIWGILEDNTGNLWLSTNKGISKFDPRNRTFKNFTPEDGLQSYEFNAGAFYRSVTGEMYFGGVNGFNCFFPSEIKDNPHVPPVVITDFRVFYEPVPIGENSPLRQSVTHSKVIRLPYSSNVFSFTFSALSYHIPGKNRYMYRLDGFDPRWVVTSASNRTAGYTNLSPGTYTFSVRGANNDGVWNREGASITIIISPPFWRTWWFRTLAIVILLGLVFVFHRWRMKHLVLQMRNETEMKQLFEKYHISSREQEIIDLIIKGKSNKEIEEELFISVKTVKNHVYSIYKKMGVNNRLELIHVIQSSRGNGMVAAGK